MHDMFSMSHPSESTGTLIPVESTNDQEYIDGVPAVHVSDTPEDFAAFLDMLLPPVVHPHPAPSPSFNFICGVLRMAHKYLIEDLKNWAVSLLQSRYPLQIEGIRVDRDLSVFKDPDVAAQLIVIARLVDLPYFLPMAFYALATHDWLANPHKQQQCETIISQLSSSDQSRIITGRAALQKEITTRAFERSDWRGLGEECRNKANEGFWCAMGRKTDVWKNPAKRFSFFMLQPLEELTSTIMHAGGIPALCQGCNQSVGAMAIKMRVELFELLPEMFDL